jgi:phosphatidylglycerophosphate synthase
VAAAWSLFQGYYVLGVLFVQAFGLWSCVDGEIARLTNTQSALGDFYDTMTDRVAEFLIIAGVFFSLQSDTVGAHWLAVFIVYTGMVFLITASSEKFRSVYGRNYPKNEQEKIFSWLCAGSDTRLLYLSVAVLAFAVSGQVAIIEWLLAVLSLLLASNFIFRMWRIKLLSSDRPA